MYGCAKYGGVGCVCVTSMVGVYVCDKYGGGVWVCQVWWGCMGVTRV